MDAPVIIDPTAYKFPSRYFIVSYPEEDFLKYCVRKYEGFDDVFEFNKLPYPVRRRFIELLPTDINHFFRKTSKANYIHSLDLKGIRCCNVTSESEVGFMDLYGELQLPVFDVTPRLQPFLIVNGNAWCEFERVERPPVYTCIKKYSLFEARFLKCADSVIIDLIEQLIHPEIEIVSLLFPDNFRPQLDVLSKILDHLRSCKKLTKLFIDYAPPVTAVYSFVSLKAMLEDFFREQTPALVGNQIRLHERSFIYYDGCLKMVEDAGKSKTTWTLVPSWTA